MSTINADQRTSRSRHRVLIKDLNSGIICPLCGGYFIDATSLVDCPHSFCRGCILKHFENSNKGCPITTCKNEHKKKSTPSFRSDAQLQALVYKMVPGLYAREMQRKEEFYRSTGVRASSSCSDDSVLGEMMNNQEEWISASIGDKHKYFNPDDTISLSLEYYQSHLDTTDPSANLTKLDGTDSSLRGETTRAKVTSDSVGHVQEQSGKVLSANSENADNGNSKISEDSDKTGASAKEEQRVLRDRRYLQCPAAVNMSHIQKFLRMKYALTSEHKVDIIYAGEVLPSHFSLMDVAYTFNWTKTKPMRFFYRIFITMKVQPIKIINTSSTGGKQLQIVPSLPQHITPSLIAPEAKHTTKQPEETILQQRTSEPVQLMTTLNTKPPTIEITPPVTAPPIREPIPPVDPSRSYQCQEQLMAHLQLKPSNNQRKKISPEPNCVYEYQEPDKEEIKRFAEKRDREWLLLATGDSPADHQISHHVSKKRKKSKHSKNEPGSVHKKRKGHHVEKGTQQQNESIKLKVKLTSLNGHKHKTGEIVVDDAPPAKKPAPSTATPPVLLPESPVNNKQELLKLRGVRHKTTPTAPAETTIPAIVKKVLEEPAKKVMDAPVKIPTPKPQEITPKLRSDFTYRHPGKDTPRPHDNNDQQTFLKSFQSYTNELNHKNAEKVTPSGQEGDPKAKQQQHAVVNSHTYTNQKMLERKIATLKQECTIEATKSTASVKKVVSFYNETKPHILNTQYNAGFTVSKIETGPGGAAVKRSEVKVVDNRPSLEITMVNPTQKVPSANKPITQHMTNASPKLSSPKVQNPGSIKPQAPVKTQNSIVNQKTQSTVANQKIQNVITNNKVAVQSSGPTKQVVTTQKALPSKLQPAAPGQKPQASTTGVKRPPPDTIPLDRIMKSNALAKAGVSITSKLTNDKSDSTGALDLSGTRSVPPSVKKVETPVKPNGVSNNGFKEPSPRTQAPLKALTKLAVDKNLSNLQMLSKVATEQSFTKNGPKPQIPNLQSIKIPNNGAVATNKVPTNSAKVPVNITKVPTNPAKVPTNPAKVLTNPAKVPPNLTKVPITPTKVLPNLTKLPKLNEINMNQYRINNNGTTQLIRSVRPSQNQNVRNIPNPSLLVRQQNQIRTSTNNTTVTTGVAVSTAQTAAAAVAVANVTKLTNGCKAESTTTTSIPPTGGGGVKKTTSTTTMSEEKMETVQIQTQVNNNSK